MKPHLLPLSFAMALLLAASAPAQNEDAPQNYSDKALEPTHKHVPYGPDPMQFINFWKAESKTPTPVIVNIHGGGWSGGAADEQMEPNAYLQRGISMASVEYRRTPGNPLPAPVMDAARAVQFIRSKAAEWGLDKNRVAFQGGSAGACTSLWLALHDDLADPGSSDPVARESTKPACIFVSNAQTCIDPMIVQEWTGGMILQHPMFFNAVGAPDMQAVLDNHAKYKPLLQQFSPINFVDSKDPPIYMKAGMPATLPAKNSGHAIHHPVFCIKLKEKLDDAGVENYLALQGTPSPKNQVDFILEHLKVAK
jgi:arylformamidase